MENKKGQTQEYVRDMSEVKSLESEIMGMEIAREEGFLKMSGYQKDVLRDAKEYLKQMQKSKDFTKASKKEWAELADTVKESLNFNASSEQIQNRIINLKKKEKTMGINTKAAQGTAKKQLANKKTGAMFGKLTKALGGLTGKMGMLMKAGGPIMLLVSAIQFIIDLFLGFNKRIADVYENFGQVGIKMKQILADSIELNKHMLSMGKKFEDIIRPAVAVGKIISMNLQESLKWGAVIVDVQKATAATEGSITTVMTALNKSRGFTLDMAQDFAKVTFATGLLSEQVAVPGAVIEDMAQNADLFYTMVNSSTKELQMAAINAMKLNTNMDTFKKIGEKILDFNTLTTNQMETQLLLGANFNVQKAAQLYQDGNILDFQREILTQIQNMNVESITKRTHQQQISEFLGIEWQQLVDINQKLQEGVDISNLNADELKAVLELSENIKGSEAQDPMSKMLNILKSELIPILEEKLVPVFEWILWAFEKMADFFATISDWLAWLNPFNDSYYQDKAIADKQKERDKVWKYGTQKEKDDLEEEIKLEQSNFEKGILPDYITEVQDSDWWRGLVNNTVGGVATLGTKWIVDGFQGEFMVDANNANSSDLYSDSGLGVSYEDRQKALVKQIFTKGGRGEMYLKDIIDTDLGSSEGLLISEILDLKEMGIDVGNKEQMEMLSESFALGWSKIEENKKHQPNSTIGKDSTNQVINGDISGGFYNNF